MKDAAEALPGLERIRSHFLNLLEGRQGMIAQHTLAAWEETDQDEIHAHLDAAQGALHQIAGSAGSLGFHDLGATARECENGILGYLASTNASHTKLPAEILNQVDGFISISQSLLAEGA